MPPPDSKNLQRRQRILDAASSLSLRFGYDKTTVEDIAREAGISKGAVYLHFKGKDLLFEALLLESIRDYSESWMARVMEDPFGGTLGGMYKNMLHALQTSPFMAALLTKDRQILGNYARKPNNLFQRMEEGNAQSTRHVFIEMLQSRGAIREDVDPKVTAHIMNMLSFGLVGLDGIIPAHQIPTVDATIDGIANMMDRAFVPTESDLSLEEISDIGKSVLRTIYSAHAKRMDSGELTKEEGEA